SGEQARRDAGFTIFYAGINLGAALAPIITGYLGERVDWHLGFGAAGVGMVLGLIQYKVTERNLGDAGLRPVVTVDSKTKQRLDRRIVKGLWATGIVLFVL